MLKEAQWNCILKMASLICTVDWSLLGLLYFDLCGTTAGSPSTSLHIYYSENSTCVLKYYTGLLNVVASLYPSFCYPIRFLTSLLFVQVTNQMHDKIVIPCSVWKLHEFLRTTVWKVKIHCHRPNWGLFIYECMGVISSIKWILNPSKLPKMHSLWKLGQR